MKKLRGVVIGAGYFSDFHLDAWSRIADVEIVAVADIELDKASNLAAKYHITGSYIDVAEMLLIEKPDFMDIVTPPETHLELIKMGCLYGITMICQKPMAPTFEEALLIKEILSKTGTRFMIHENFRFQPWHREIKKLLDTGLIGEVHNFYFQSRLGDGYGEDAYLTRQPYFRTYKKLLIYETGIHFIDVFRYLGGEVKEVYARLRRLNPIIQGEDAGVLQFTMQSGAWATWDANRYNEDSVPNKRYTFGTFLIEGSMGSIRLDQDGRISIQELGKEAYLQPYEPSKIGFAGDSCYALQQHFIDSMFRGTPFETDIEDYIKNLEIQELIYQSNLENRPLFVHSKLEASSLKSARNKNLKIINDTI